MAKNQIDYTKLTWMQMADIIMNIWVEMKHRNPIGINFYRPALNTAHAAVLEIAEAELEHSTCEAGPKIKKASKPLKAVPCPICSKKKI